MQYPSYWKLSKETNRYALAGIAFFIGGVAVNWFAYKSLDPMVVTLLLVSFGGVIIQILPNSGPYERRMYLISFAVMWFMAGVAAVYSNIFNDYDQNYSDAAGFYFASIDGTHRLSFDDVNEFSVGAFAIYVWGYIYDMFRYFGFEDGKYVGIALNITAVSLTGVASIRIARLTIGDDLSRLNRLTKIFISCGLFWLFSSLHLRDAMGLLLITCLIYLWVRLLVYGTLADLIMVAAATLLLTPILAGIRPDFIYVPAALILSAIASTSLFARNIAKSARSNSVTRYFAILLGLLIALTLVGIYYDEVVQAFEYRSEGYKKFTSDEAADSSLGNRFIAQASWPVRLVLGTAYLFVYPIPVWSGFQMEVAYHLFKSMNALMFYFLTPLFILALVRIIGDRKVRTPVLMFIVITFFGFTIAVALTSVETRHWGAFLVPMMVISLIPDLTANRDRTAYLRLTTMFIISIVGGHLFWAGLKFGI